MILNILFTIFLIAILIIWCAQEQNNRSRILEYFLIGDCISGVKMLLLLEKMKGRSLLVIII